MFEKSLYDLIEGLRNHKGNEKEYIQNNLKECRAEIKGQDKDLKATALLKLVYLEMFGYDMSWAAFHVLEVMSSANYLQKRVGYLGAVQSFRADTEVLMLATNLLKKDLTTTAVPTLSLPIAALPHIVTSSLALLTLQDLLPRINHSEPAIRKKTIVTLYRLALVYPETLRPAWPKIKSRLMDVNEDASVIASIVNVICELGWRRPQDILPLVPRLFELLVEGGNNWMAIKLIKLFASLTQLEPRLVRKLLPHLTAIIQTTPAMSLLYECINGIIQGGIFDSAVESAGGEEIAALCVSKLRGMIMIEGDANLKFVALLAFNKIVVTHPILVSQQEDVIMDCIDSTDLLIRLRALDLVVRMVDSDNLIPIISRLMRQLRDLRSVSSEAARNQFRQIETNDDSDVESPKGNNCPEENRAEAPHMPNDYKLSVISRILDMCSNNNYGNLIDFQWYINILIKIFRLIPTSASITLEGSSKMKGDFSISKISERIGDELRNVAVKVKAVRMQATRAAELLMVSTCNDESSTKMVNSGFLGPIAWVVGEFASSLATPEISLNALLRLLEKSIEPGPLITYLHALPKVFSFIASDNQTKWTPERKTMISLLLSRIIYVLESLTTHPNLEVQERSVEYSELLKLSAEASSSHDANFQQEPPLILTKAIPSLFLGLELNSIAPGAQKIVPKPSGLDLNQEINENLKFLLDDINLVSYEDSKNNSFDAYYYNSIVSISVFSGATASNHFSDEEQPQPDQLDDEKFRLDPDIIEKRRAERTEKNKDDPFYIFPIDVKSEFSETFDSLNTGSKSDFNVNEIPILSLNPDETGFSEQATPKILNTIKHRKRVEVAADETIVISDIQTMDLEGNESKPNKLHKVKSKKNSSLLQVDSSYISTFCLENNIPEVSNSFGQDRDDETEIAKAMNELEMQRLEMQRASERIQAPQSVERTTVIKKKKKIKKNTIVPENIDQGRVKGKKKSKISGEDNAIKKVGKKKKKAPKNAD
ncbi:AP-3 complex subunit delta [Golovinomyces cichoracearum]|uniref:AP-3 complex subunit delta n=1 Tax=Golovinomyces cichoracearum TaxID=62708 RepID=A0A420IDP3_9PEZI|nr:AP-3 complex subunit delta [Golovinomyces cichoracearum]